MRTSTTERGRTRYLKRFAALSLAALVVLSIFSLNDYTPTAQQQVRNRGGEQRQKLNTAKTEPRNTKGAPYPPAKPSDRIPNPDPKPRPVPTGPKVGNMRPANPASGVKQITSRDGKIPQPTRTYDHAPKQTSLVQPSSSLLSAEHSPKLPAISPPPAPLFFKQYRELTGLIGSTSGCCPEISSSENGQTIMMTANNWMSLSEDGGGSFSNINPTTVFPQDDGGFCCDQVVVYVPRIDMFVWLLQYWSGADGKNRLRLAAQTTPEVRSSNGTAWTYWDFVSDIFDTRSSLDYNDIGVGENSLWWTSQNGTGRVVVRIPLTEIAAKGTINFAYTGGTDALWSHLTQNATNTVYWAGHVSNSELRVFSMRDGDGFYSWRSVTVNSWPNGTNSMACPDKTERTG